LKQMITYWTINSNICTKRVYSVQ